VAGNPLYVATYAAQIPKGGSGAFSLFCYGPDVWDTVRNGVSAALQADLITQSLPEYENYPAVYPDGTLVIGRVTLIDSNGDFHVYELPNVLDREAFSAFFEGLEGSATYKTEDGHTIVTANVKFIGVKPTSTGGVVGGEPI
jgi:hypothetical protein